MRLQKLIDFDLSDTFNLRSVASLEEPGNHDLIYIYHHLQPGTEVILEAAGYNVKGDIRYKVLYKNFILGFVTFGGFFRTYYESNEILTARIAAIKKEKFLPVKELDIEVDLVRLKNVS